MNDTIGHAFLRAVLGLAPPLPLAAPLVALCAWLAVLAVLRCDALDDPDDPDGPVSPA